MKLNINNLKKLASDLIEIFDKLDVKNANVLKLYKKISAEKKTWLIAHFDIEKVEQLLQKDIDLNIKNEYGMTSLHIACIEGDYNKVELLLKYNADPNIVDNFGNSALHHACYCNNSDLVELLLKYNVEIIENNYFGNSAMTWALFHNNEKIINLLKERI
jgi:ankyrin repeat protein